MWADDQIIEQVQVAEMRGKKSLGRPRTRWKDSVMKDLNAP